MPADPLPPHSPARPPPAALPEAPSAAPQKVTPPPLHWPFWIVSASPWEHSQDACVHRARTIQCHSAHALMQTTAVAGLLAGCCFNFWCRGNGVGLLDFDVCDARLQFKSMGGVNGQRGNPRQRCPVEVEKGVWPNIKVQSNQRSC
jgi:hypothetical protein